MPAVQAEGGRPAGGAEATGETPIYGPALASTQGPRTAHWRLVMWGRTERWSPAAASPPTGLLMSEALTGLPGPRHLRRSEGRGCAEAAGLVLSPVREAARQPGWGQGACALARPCLGPLIPSFLGLGPPHTSPTIILSPSPGTLGGDLHCLGLVLKGPAGWMVMAELGHGNQGNQICPGSGARRPGVLGTASPTASCWGTLLSRGPPWPWAQAHPLCVVPATLVPPRSLAQEQHVGLRLFLGPYAETGTAHSASCHQRTRGYPWPGRPSLVDRLSLRSWALFSSHRCHLSLRFSPRSSQASGASAKG
ncbi:uncharacterized protein LOC109488397 [Ailuropoda melanoleuca]|uniref:uncharacterized protein LOC109488397 n=1 Tax=Ailuropoda melanoleuca TaxID=9646 RepID=UPI001494D747|nr:uncharacterized protein LOC109488397 [Ailuropoda melanoleuca]